MKTNKIIFISAIIIQLLLLLIIPVPRWILLNSGKTIELITIPYDPYNIFRGYYVDLRYEISRQEGLPAWEKLEQNRFYYVILQKDQDGIWSPRKVQVTLPVKLNQNQAVIRGKYRYGMMTYGFEQYYLPETKRLEVEKLLRDQNNRVIVQVKVNDVGASTILRLNIAGKNFDY